MTANPKLTSYLRPVETNQSKVEKESIPTQYTHSTSSTEERTEFAQVPIEVCHFGGSLEEETPLIRASSFNREKDRPNIVIREQQEFAGNPSSSVTFPITLDLADWNILDQSYVSRLLSCLPKQNMDADFSSSERDFQGKKWQCKEKKNTQGNCY